jgi:hypothetical protein
VVISELEISKNQIRKAGKILKSVDSSSDDRNDALDLLSEWRTRHAYPLNQAYKIVNRIAVPIDKKAIFGQRLKRAKSIISKLQRLKSGLNEMQDIAGSRVILNNYKQLLEVDSKLLTGKNILNNRGKDYIQTPKHDGYRSVHRIYKYQGSKLEHKDLLVEIQLRTRLQHAWATSVEIIDTFLGEQLKLGKGSKEWKHFFYLVANQFAKLENLPNDASYIELEELKLLVKELNVINRMSGYANMSFQAAQVKDVGDQYFLLVLHPQIHEVKVIPFKKKPAGLKSAKDMYSALEKSWTVSSDYDVVLVSGSSIKELKMSYPNYFADSKLFLKKLKELVEN